ncbi:FAD-dependent oxidoreductase [[Limnothrix rosea] IAM M-220]|uniref:FAD-dependent oxidoreductase n=1 Tax=[Limnothrix rosea] IAM M-220 TaxID=454133 RepID=UPI0009632043|nr:FAD-dependent oxidoreductase [[Limnothrix rosea] IAM M-220]OKH17213.1 hypothetical protein NIES208_10400 [[Limnothrix rosea] IAM M-220]
MDYDLVIIGATRAGLNLAQKAIAEGQRVALIQQVSQPLQDIQLRALERVLLHNAITSWEQLQTEITAAIAPTDFYEPLAKLIEKGVDVVPERGKFHWRPNPVFVTEKREFQGNNYAIATGTVWQQTDDPRHLTFPDFLQPQTWKKLRPKILFQGITPALLALAYTLCKQGKQVQFLLGFQFFSAEDQQLTHRLQTFLEVEGIEIYRNPAASDIAKLLNRKDINIIDGDRRQGNITHLNLPPRCFRGKQPWLKVNHRLQAPASNIYGCGSVLGGYDLTEVAIAETSYLAQSITAKKAQLCPYHLVPYRLFEPYPFDHVGYQPKDLPSDGITLEKTFYLDYVDQHRFPFDVTIKLWLSKEEKILGATVLGDRSGKLIYHCRDLIQTQQTFKSWQNLLEYSGIAAEICW